MMSGDSPAKASADPSMDDILASIRRILSDEEQQQDAAPHGFSTPVDADGDDVLALDESMLIMPSAPPEVAAPVSADAENPPDAIGTELPMPAPLPAPIAITAAELAAPQSAAPVLVASQPDELPSLDSPFTPLVAPAAAQAATQSISALVRSLHAERAASIYRGGPTIEDVVREEIRPVLKLWLDTHLPGMVERIVRSEIERLAGRVGA